MMDKKRAQSVSALRRSFLEQIKACEDGKVMARNHMRMDARVLLAAVSSLIESFQFQGLTSNLENPGQNCLDYLEEALRLIGHPEVADLVQSNLADACRQSIGILNKKNMDKFIHNADAMDLLIP